MPMTTRSLRNTQGLIKEQPTKMESMSWVPHVRRFAIEILLSARRPFIHPHSTPNANADDNPKPEKVAENIEGK